MTEKHVGFQRKPQEKWAVDIAIITVKIYNGSILYSINCLWAERNKYLLILFYEKQMMLWNPFYTNAGIE